MAVTTFGVNLAAGQLAAHPSALRSSMSSAAATLEVTPASEVLAAKNPPPQ